MSDKTRNFDSEARFWDENPGRVKMAKSVAAAILQNIDITDKMDLLDFGCGTGLLTLHLQPHVKMISGADSSQGMLDILASKIETLGFSNVRIIYLEYGSTEKLTDKYDLVVSSMTLHHVRDVSALLRKFRTIVKHGGHICIADLDSDNGLFHEDSTGVFHNGFDRAALAGEFEKAGFTDVKTVTAAEAIKPAPDGGDRKFSIFLMSGSVE